MDPLLTTRATWCSMQGAHQEKVLHVDMGFFQNAMLGKKSHVDMGKSHVNMGFFPTWHFEKNPMLT
jgi:hypothetical protein